jgi:Rrf2 family protein
VSSPTNTRFAVAYHVLGLLAGFSSDALSSEQMAPNVGASPVYLRRVLGLLRRAGLVESRPGVGGGWSLTRPADEISLGDVWRAVRGEEPVLGVHGPPEHCPVGGAVVARLAQVEDRVARAIEAALDAITVAEVVPDGAPFPVELLSPPVQPASAGR